MQQRLAFLVFDKAEKRSEASTLLPVVAVVVYLVTIFTQADQVPL
jgi:hypothetical protein